jgi:hypothetical protein
VSGSWQRLGPSSVNWSALATWVTDRFGQGSVSAACEYADIVLREQKLPVEELWAQVRFPPTSAVELQLPARKAASPLLPISIGKQSISSRPDHAICRIRQVRAVRPGAIETREQERYVLAIGVCV